MRIYLHTLWLDKGAPKHKAKCEQDTYQIQTYQESFGMVAETVSFPRYLLEFN